VKRWVVAIVTASSVLLTVAMDSWFMTSPFNP